ncbi:MAG: type II secretion system protein GspG [Planctomycetes bacterium]|nr:type II secretion system protein GspG [Planctomycetota bacterium]
MQSSIGRLGVFLLIICGIVSYLWIGVGLFEKVKSSAIGIELRSLDRMLQGHKFTQGSYPKDLLEYLHSKTKNLSGKTIGADPWGTLYRYESSRSGFKISSAGPDRTFESEDDVTWVRDKRKSELVVSKTKLSKRSRVRKIVAQAPKGDVFLQDFHDLLKSELNRGVGQESSKEIANILEIHISQLKFE